jgi:hypothetical protein
VDTLLDLLHDEEVQQQQQGGIDGDSTVRQTLHVEFIGRNGRVEDTMVHGGRTRVLTGACVAVCAHLSQPQLQPRTVTRCRAAGSEQPACAHVAQPKARGLPTAHSETNPAESTHSTLTPTLTLTLTWEGGARAAARVQRCKSCESWY